MVEALPGCFRRSVAKPQCKPLRSLLPKSLKQTPVETPGDIPTGLVCCPGWFLHDSNVDEEDTPECYLVSVLDYPSRVGDWTLPVQETAGEPPPVRTRHSSA